MEGPDFDDSQGMTSVHFEETGDVYITIVDMIEKYLKIGKLYILQTNWSHNGQKGILAWKLLAKLDFDKWIILTGKIEVAVHKCFEVGVLFSNQLEKIKSQESPL